MSFDKQIYLKKKCRIFIIFNLIGLILILYNSFYYYQTYNSNNNLIHILKYNLVNSNKTIRDLNFALEIIKNSKKFSINTQVSGTATTGIQYDLAKEKLLELIKFYKIYPSSTFYATKQIELSDLTYTNSSGKYVLTGSDVRLSLKNINDIQAIQFLQTMVNYLPGYWKIEYLRMRKVNDINQTFTADIKDRISRVGVTTEIGLEWYDFLKKN